MKPTKIEDFRSPSISAIDKTYTIMSQSPFSSVRNGASERQSLHSSTPDLKPSE